MLSSPMPKRVDAVKIEAFAFLLDFVPDCLPLRDNHHYDKDLPPYGKSFEVPVLTIPVLPLFIANGK
jgi:hypothetical protein